MISIVKRLILFVTIFCLYIAVRPNTDVHADMLEGHDDAGNVDVLSEEFINAFVYNFSHYDYADIKRGMTLGEVENQLNVSLEEVTREVDTQATELRANDLIVVMVDDAVDSIYIEPQETITKEEILSHFSTPTGELSEAQISRGNSAIEYKVLPSANFKVIVAFDSDDHVLYIKHTLDETTSVVNTDNAVTFIERGISLNSADPENFVFETPETTESGDLLIRFDSEDLDGYLTLTQYGELDVYDSAHEHVSSVSIPFYGN